MEENIKILKQNFDKIKNKKLNKSLRIGTTGIGYTFESLINKNEDNNYLPDFNGIEIKTKLGYTKTAITLFTLTPKKDNDECIKYIYNNFGYPNKANKDYKSFKGDIFHNKNNIIANRYIFKMKVNIENNKLKLLILDTNLNLLNDTIYWNLQEIQNRLETKLSYLAIIKGYKYNENNEDYYKYTNLNIYKLLNFKTFIKLLEQDKIYITFNIDTFLGNIRFGQIHDRGTAFKLKQSSIKELFNSLY